MHRKGFTLVHRSPHTPCADGTRSVPATLRRKGFTLVEMMVAIALTMFVMVILSQAFISGLETFSQLKSIGDMEQKLRMAATVIVNDLKQDHFDGKRRPSDIDFWSNPPTQGYLRIFHGTQPGAKFTLNGFNQPFPAYEDEGEDLDSVPQGIAGNAIAPPRRLASFRATNHMIHFTSKQRGNRREHLYTAIAPVGSPLLGTSNTFFGLPADSLYQDATNVIQSPWAEIGYGLVLRGSMNEPAVPPPTFSANPPLPLSTPLYALCRHQYLVLANPAPANAASLPATALAGHSAFCCRATPTLFFPSPADLVSPDNRVFARTTPPALGAANRNPVKLPYTGLITAAGGTPITITSPNHGLQTGMTVTISGVNGNTTANGTYAINVVSPNQFQLVNSVSTGAYSNGGIWTANLERNILLSDVISFQVRILRQRTQIVTIAFGNIIVSPGHGLVNGDQVHISGITDANYFAFNGGPRTVQFVTRDQFRLVGVTGTGAYSGGGVWTKANAIFEDLPMPAGPIATTIPIPYDSGNVGTAAAPAQMTPNYLLRAVEITIRVWDRKTKQVRQVTLVQDM